MRKLSTLFVCVATSLVFAGVAAASNGGLTPESPVTPNAHKITSAYWLILALTGVIFLLVEGALITFVFRFRSRGRARTVEGPDIHGSTRLETAWTILPVLILAAIATFVFIQLPGFIHPAAADKKDALHVKVIAHQFYWEYRYDNGALAFDTLTVPQNRLVELDISSEDVAHSWWIPAFGPKSDAIPGQTNHLWLKVSKTGLYHGQCSELCGILHAKMTEDVNVVAKSAFDTWYGAQASVSGAKLGKALFDASCAKCHGAEAQGFVGPAIAGNPATKDAKLLEAIVRNGIRRMPPVGNGWTDAEVSALSAYFKAHTFKGATSG